MSGDGKGDREIQVLRALTRTIIKDSDERHEEAVRVFTKSWLYAALELPEVAHYEAITYAYMKIISKKTNALDNEEFESLIQQCENRFGKYEVDDLVKYYLSSEFAD